VNQALRDYQKVWAVGSRFPKPLPDWAAQRVAEALELALLGPEKVAELRGQAEAAAVEAEAEAAEGASEGAEAAAVEAEAVTLPPTSAILTRPAPRWGAGEKLPGTKKARRKDRQRAEAERVEEAEDSGDLQLKVFWRCAAGEPRYALRVAGERGRPMRQRTGPGGRGRRSMARLYRRRYLTQLIRAVVDRTVRLWKQLVPYGFNHPRSHRWRRLNRRSTKWSRFGRRYLRFGRHFSPRVLGRIKKGRKLRRRHQRRLFRRPQDHRESSLAPLRYRSITGNLWRRRLRGILRSGRRRRRSAKAHIWLNRQMTAVYQDARVNFRTGEIRHATRTKRFVLRRRKVRSYRRRRRAQRRLRRRLLRWVHWSVHSPALRPLPTPFPPSPALLRQ